MADGKVTELKEVARTEKPQRRISEDLVRRSRARPAMLSPFQVPSFPPVVEQALRDNNIPTLAQDEMVSGTFGWAAQDAIFASFAEGVVFLGYSYLATLAQRAEYRVVTETIAAEMVREWIELVVASDDQTKTDRKKQIEDRFEELEVRDCFRKCTESDGFFGRGHLYLDTGKTDESDELLTDLGNGRNMMSKTKIGPNMPQKLIRLQPVEATWAYPTHYESVDPLKRDWYRPVTWYVMSREIHRSRFLTFIMREVPDILKPAYAFGGLSMSQMLKPYVDNWLRTRQSVSDLLQNFSHNVLHTNMDATTSVGGDVLMGRVALFNNIKNNQGTIVIDKDSEDWSNVSVPLGGLDHLQAQSQEHMAAIARIPLVKLLGIQPAGLNASSEGELISFEDWIASAQEFLFRVKLQTILDFTQLSLFGNIDDDIQFKFKPLRQLKPLEEAQLQQVVGQTRQGYYEMGAVDAQEVREALGQDPDTPFDGLDLSKPIPPGMGMPGGMGGGGPGEPPKGPGGPPALPAPPKPPAMPASKGNGGQFQTDGYIRGFDEKLGLGQDRAPFHEEDVTRGGDPVNAGRFSKTPGTGAGKVKPPPAKEAPEHRPFAAAGGRHATGRAESEHEAETPPIKPPPAHFQINLARYGFKLLHDVSGTQTFVHEGSKGNSYINVLGTTDPEAEPEWLLRAADKIFEDGKGLSSLEAKLKELGFKKRRLTAAHRAEVAETAGAAEHIERRHAIQLRVDEILARSGSQGWPFLPDKPAREVTEAIADFFDYGPEHRAKIKITSERRFFTLNDKRMESAGTAWTHGPDKGRIEIRNETMPPSHLAGTVAHEINHIRWQTVADAYRQDYTQLHKTLAELADPSVFWDEVVDREGQFRDTERGRAAKEKYPVYDALHSLIGVGADFGKFEKDDGITDYSREYWKAHAEEKGHGQYLGATLNARDLAIHETLAEMGRLDWEGLLQSLLWYKESKSFKPLYNAIQRLYPKAASSPPVGDAEFVEEDHPRARGGRTAGQFVRKGEEGAAAPTAIKREIPPAHPGERAAAEPEEPAPYSSLVRPISAEYGENLPRYGFQHLYSSRVGGSSVTHIFQREDKKRGQIDQVEIYSPPDKPGEQNSWTLYYPGMGGETMEGKGWDALKQAFNERGYKARSLKPEQKEDARAVARRMQRAEHRAHAQVRISRVLEQSLATGHTMKLDSGEALEICNHVADFFDYGREHKQQIQISPEHKQFTLNGKRHDYGGAAYTREGLSGGRKGDIKIFNDVVGPTGIAGVAAHEINHIRWQTVLDAYDNERKELERRSGEAGFWDQGGIMAPSGELRSAEARKQYPVYARLWPLIDAKYTKLVDDDGCTDYSREYWKGYDDRTVGIDSARHETLAEMGRLDWDGSLDRMLWYKDSETWKPLYQAVQEIYPTLVEPAYEKR